MKKEIGNISTLMVDVPEDDDIRSELDKALKKLQRLAKELLGHLYIFIACLIGGGGGGGFACL